MRQKGFTLLELLVALVIAGVLVGVATLSIGAFERGLRFEVERLAQLLYLAREEALVRGTPIRLEVHDEGYRFIMLRDRRWQPIRDDRDLRERGWLGPTRVAIERADGMPVIEFGHDQVGPPFALRFERDGESVTVVSNGLGAFELR